MEPKAIEEALSRIFEKTETMSTIVDAPVSALLTGLGLEAVPELHTRSEPGTSTVTDLAALTLPDPRRIAEPEHDPGAATMPSPTLRADGSQGAVIGVEPTLIQGDAAATVPVPLDDALRPSIGPLSHSGPSANFEADAGESLSLGRFAVGVELGRGGMGKVLEGRDPELRRQVAIKVLVNPREVSPKQLARFVAEAQITAQLEHPNIVPIYDMGVTEDGRIYFVMKKVEGLSLRQLQNALIMKNATARKEWTRRKLLNAFVQVCNALAYAHRRLVLHRDIKPENIMLGEYGEVLVLDWGVARIMDRREAGSASAPTTEMEEGAAGTPGYMPPETVLESPDRLDARADVWSLGAVLFEMLTLHRAYKGKTPIEMIKAAVKGPPEMLTDDAQRRGLGLPEELAAICMKALAARPADRYSSALELAGAVEEFLEGAKEKERAAERAIEAEELWAEYHELDNEHVKLLEEIARLEDELPAWMPLSERGALLEATERLEAVDIKRARAFGLVIGACERALSHDPENDDARELLAEAYWSRLKRAEAVGDQTEVSYYAERVREFDDGQLAALLEGTGSLSLITEPPGARVICRQLRQQGLTWQPAAPVDVGPAPLSRHPLPMGSYLLTLSAPGHEELCYPVHIPRGRHWKGRGHPVFLPAAGTVPEGFVHVSPGPFLRGGDPDAVNAVPSVEEWLDGYSIAVFPVTAGEYLSFINALLERDPEAAWSRVPRQTDWGGGGRFWERPEAGERFRLPEVDDQGSTWLPDRPIVSISHDDALAYAGWRSEKDGRTYRLPTELEWEKAARGVDGRFFPWGDRFDASLCLMRRSVPGRPSRQPVGKVEADCSVYGVRDTAGSVREWCGDEHFDGDPTLRVIKGGSLFSDERACRPAGREDMEATAVSGTVGFRLVCDA